MTGWRLGYLVLPPGLAKTVLKFIQHSIYCVPNFVQHAGMTALSLADELVPAYRAMFRSRLKTAAERLSSVPGIRCAMPPATFYLFPSVAAPDADVARRWLDEMNVATCAGLVLRPRRRRPPAHVADLLGARARSHRRDRHRCLSQASSPQNDFSITSYIGVADGAEDLDHPDDLSGLAPEARFVDLDQ
jgi:hypothetical protein